MKYSISCGNKLTAEAAEKILKKGGTAFDAMVGASFASYSTEPMLTSAGGVGGALLRFSDGRTKAVDFLANFPSRTDRVKPIKKVVSFGDETQAFYLGYGSMAVPGNLEGLLYIHDRHCTLGLDEILKPAVKYAKANELDPMQAFVLQILEPFCKYTEESSEVFAPKGRLLKKGDTIRNRKFSDFLKFLADDRKAAMQFYYKKIRELLEGKKSALTFSDVKSYRVYERKPLAMKYKGYDIELFPPPSAGGKLIAYGLELLKKAGPAQYEHNSTDHIRILAEVMKKCDEKRTSAFFKNLLGGTTHISILDSDGNAASMTTSNGQSAGIMIKDTGIMFNNFAGEPDLMQYAELYRPGKRMTTMMTPTIISRNGKIHAVLGSGGSNRIRSAIIQAVSNMLDFGMEPEKASNSTRVHFEENLLQLEYGINKKVCDELSKEYNTNLWTKKNLFFGGVHIAAPGKGGGDKRRGGHVILSK